MSLREKRNTFTGTIIIAAVLCVVCSIVVSAMAVGLRPIKEKNQQLAFQRQVLKVTGLSQPGEAVTDEEVEKRFQQVKSVLIDFETGKPAETEEVDPETFSLEEVVSNPELTIEIPAEKDVAGLGEREKFTKVYFVLDDQEKIDQIVLPVRGKGLWSTMWGLLSLDSDTKTVRGLTFYSDGETPGLGGEINNQNWQNQWSKEECPKILYSEDKNVQISFYKGSVECGMSNSEHRFEALAGATITTRGVETMMHYWLGDHAYKPLLENIQSGEFNQVVTASL